MDCEVFTAGETSKGLRWAYEADSAQLAAELIARGCFNACGRMFAADGRTRGNGQARCANGCRSSSDAAARRDSRADRCYSGYAHCRPHQRTRCVGCQDGQPDGLAARKRRRLLR